LHLHAGKQFMSVLSGSFFQAFGSTRGVWFVCLSS
jgi:hypothetical protein